MHSAPIDSWEGAEAIFTFANSPTMLALFLILTVVVIVASIVQSAHHENKSFKRTESEN